MGNAPVIDMHGQPLTEGDFVTVIPGGGPLVAEVLGIFPNLTPKGPMDTRILELKVRIPLADAPMALETFIIHYRPSKNLVDTSSEEKK